MRAILDPFNSVYVRRWIYGLLLLTVFFLPLHIHIASASSSQITQECSCINGGRSEVGQIVALALAAPLISQETLLAYQQLSVPAHKQDCHSSRAPPAR